MCSQSVAIHCTSAQVFAMKYRSRMTATDAAILTVNASYRNEISAQDLVDIFKRRASPWKWQSHIGVFFSEVPDSVVHGFMQENGISVDMLRRVYSELPPVLQAKRFKSMFS